MTENLIWRSQVLDEIGIDVSAQLGAAPRRPAALPQQAQAARSSDELEQRMAALRQQQ